MTGSPCPAIVGSDRSDLESLLVVGVRTPNSRLPKTEHRAGTGHTGRKADTGVGSDAPALLARSPTSGKGQEMSDSFVLYGSPHSQYTYKVALMLRASGVPFSFRYVSFQQA